MAINIKFSSDIKPVEDAQKRVTQNEEREARKRAMIAKKGAMAGGRGAGSSAVGQLTNVPQIKSLGALGAGMMAVTAVINLGIKAVQTYVKELQLGVKWAQAWSDIQQKRVSEVDKELTAQEQGAQRLSELSQKEKLSNKEKLEATRILKDMSAEYRQLGVTINENGKIIGAENAELQMVEKNRQTRIKELERMDEYLKKTKAAQEKIIKSSFTKASTKESAEAEYLKISEQQLNISKELHKLRRSTPVGDLEADRLAASKDKIAEITKEYREKNKAIRDSLKSNADAVELENIVLNLRKQNIHFSYTEYNELEKIIKLRKELSSKKYLKDNLDSLLSQRAVQRLINSGLESEAAALRISNDLRKEGLALSKSQIAGIVDLQKKLASTELTGNLKSTVAEMESELKRMKGNVLAADISDALRNAREQKGFELTPAEISKIEKITKLQYEMAKTPDAFKWGSKFDTITNSLTSRGGFASGAVTSGADKVNQTLKSVAKAHIDRIARLETVIQSLKTV